MRISDIKVFPVWGGNRNYLFVKVETDEGIYGIGESGLTWCELAVKEIVHALVKGSSARIQPARNTCGR